MQHPLNILIVEDNELVAMLLADTLVALGHHVCATVATEAAAVAGAATYRPDVLIVDSTLAEGSGVDAVATILESGFIPHVFVTGDAMAVATQRPGAIVLQKPFFVPELVGAIAQAVAERVLH